MNAGHAHVISKFRLIKTAPEPAAFGLIISKCLAFAAVTYWLNRAPLITSPNNKMLLNSKKILPLDTPSPLG